MKATLIKNKEAGFAYSATQIVAKIEIREVGNAWKVFLKTGTKGGTLEETSSFAGNNETEAAECMENMISGFLSLGYVKEL